MKSIKKKNLIKKININEEQYRFSLHIIYRNQENIYENTENVDSNEFINNDKI